MRPPQSADEFDRPATSVRDRSDRSFAGARRTELDHLDDECLVGLCRDGDEAAWRCLVQRYRRLVYAVPLHMGLGEDGADEVFLETFARLVQRIGAMRRPERVRAWVVTTARRLSVDALRRSRRWAEPIPLERLAAEGSDAATILQSADTGRESVLDELARLSERDLVHRALHKLGRRCRRLLQMLYPREHEAAAESSSDATSPATYREISRAMDLPIGSIGPTRARCLHRLSVEVRRLDEPPKPRSRRR